MAIDFSEWQPETPFTEWEDEELGLEESETYDEGEYFGEDETRIAGTAPLAAVGRRMIAAPGAAPSPGAPRIAPGNRLIAGRAYAKIVGAKQSTFLGDVQSKGHEGWLTVTGFEYSIKSPRDAATGQAAGKRQHTPITITLAWGPWSPQLFSALVQNELLNTVTLEFVGVRATGEEQISQRLTLTNASVSELRRVNDQSLGGAPFEKVALTFQQIAFDDLVGKTSAQDSWTSPVTELEYQYESEFEEPLFEAETDEGWVVETYELEDEGVRPVDGFGA